MTNCQKCGKPLKLIGTERKNGKGNYKDWKDNDKKPREYHKKCYLEEQKYKDIMYNFKRWNITDTDKIDFLLN